jgi:hypothetical protein
VTSVRLAPTPQSRAERLHRARARAVARPNSSGRDRRSANVRFLQLSMLLPMQFTRAKLNPTQPENVYLTEIGKFSWHLPTCSIHAARSNSIAQEYPSVLAISALSLFSIYTNDLECQGTPERLAKFISSCPQPLESRAVGRERLLRRQGAGRDRRKGLEMGEFVSELADPAPSTSPPRQTADYAGGTQGIYRVSGWTTLFGGPQLGSIQRWPARCGAKVAVEPRWAERGELDVHPWRGEHTQNSVTLLVVNDT